MSKITELKKEEKSLENKLKEVRKAINRGDIKALMKRVSSIEDIFKELDEEEVTEADFDHLPKETRRKQYLSYCLQAVNRLFGFKPDWNNTNQYKYYPLFRKGPSGWVFIRSSYRNYVSNAVVGFYETSDISDFVGKTFIKLYTEYSEIQ